MEETEKYLQIHVLLYCNGGKGQTWRRQRSISRYMYCSIVMEGRDKRGGDREVSPDTCTALL